MNESVVYGQASLPTGIRSRFADNGNGLAVHFLEAGFEQKAALDSAASTAFGTCHSWRKVILPLAAERISAWLHPTQR